MINYVVCFALVFICDAIYRDYTKKKNYGKKQSVIYFIVSTLILALVLMIIN